MFFKKKMQIASKEVNTQSYYINSNYPTQVSEFNGFYSTNILSNPIVYRCVELIAKSVASVQLLMYQNGIEIEDGQILNIIRKPNNFESGHEFIEKIFMNLSLFGNAYIECVFDQNGMPENFNILSSDKMSIVTNETNFPSKYLYKLASGVKILDIDSIIHIRNFNLADSLYGISPLNAAKNSIEQHNESVNWNKSLMRNGGRPSGILMRKDANAEELTPDQLNDIRNQIEKEFVGPRKSGKVMVLEGGFEWKETSINPKDMEFSETQNTAARNIALSFGIPPQLLGIKGDNTYSNYSEARISFYQERIIPLLKSYISKVEFFLNKAMQNKSFSTIKLIIDEDSIPALSEQRYNVWNYLNNSSFLTDEEKREILGFNKKKIIR